MINLLKEEIERASKSQAAVLEPGKNRQFHTKDISARGFHVHINVCGVKSSRGMFKYFLLPEICQSRKLLPIPNFDYFSSINQKRKVYQASPYNLDSEKCE